MAEDWGVLREHVEQKWRALHRGDEMPGHVLDGFMETLQPMFERLGVTDPALAVRLHAAGVDAANAPERYAEVGATTLEDICHLAFDLGCDVQSVGVLSREGLRTVAEVESHIVAFEGVPPELVPWFHATRPKMTGPEIRSVLERGLSVDDWGDYLRADVDDVDKMVELKAAGVDGRRALAFVRAGVCEPELMVRLGSPKAARRLVIPHWVEAPEIGDLRQHLEALGGGLDFAGVEAGRPAFSVRGIAVADVREAARSAGVDVEAAGSAFRVGGHWVGEASDVEPAPDVGLDVPAWWPDVQAVLDDHLGGHAFLRFEMEVPDGPQAGVLEYRALYSPDETSDAPVTLQRFAGAFRVAVEQWHRARPIEGPPRREFGHRVIRVRFAVWTFPTSGRYLSPATAAEMHERFPGTTFAVEEVGERDARTVMELSWAGGPSLEVAASAFRGITGTEFLEDESNGEAVWALSFYKGFVLLRRFDAPPAGAPHLDPPELTGR